MGDVWGVWVVWVAWRIGVWMGDVWGVWVGDVWVAWRIGVWVGDVWVASRIGVWMASTAAWLPTGSGQMPPSSTLIYELKSLRKDNFGEGTTYTKAAGAPPAASSPSRPTLTDCRFNYALEGCDGGFNDQRS